MKRLLAIFSIFLVLNSCSLWPGDGSKEDDNLFISMDNKTLDLNENKLPAEIPDLDFKSGLIDHTPLPKFQKVAKETVSEDELGTSKVIIWADKEQYQIGDTGKFYLRLSNYSEFDRKFAFEGVCDIFFQVNVNDVDIINSKSTDCNFEESFELVIPALNHAYWGYEYYFKEDFPASDECFILGTIRGVGSSKDSFVVKGMD